MKKFINRYYLIFLNDNILLTLPNQIGSNNLAASQRERYGRPARVTQAMFYPQLLEYHEGMYQPDPYALIIHLFMPQETYIQMPPPDTSWPCRN